MKSTNYSDAFAAWNDPLRQFDLTLEHPWYGLVSRLQSSLLSSSQRFFLDRGISPVLTPVTVPSVSSPMGHGSDSLPVQVRLFGEDVYLSDSTQFCLEMLMRHHPNGVFYVMPSFRGEPSDDTHLNEFFHIEAEIPGTLEGVMGFVNDYIRSITAAICDEFSDALKAAGSLTSIEKYLAAPDVPVLTFAETERLLDREAECFTFFEGMPVSLTRLGEARIYEYLGGPCWVTHYPEISVPFYQASQKGIALNADFLIGGRETVGAGQRHIDVAALGAALDLRGNRREEYAWYLRMKERTPLQTAGFGMGIERFLMWILGHNDIRDLELFIRTRGSRGYA